MSIDLTEAVEAGARAQLAMVTAPAVVEWIELSPGQHHSFREHALPLVTAAAPLIEAQVREQIAREIEAEAETYGSQSAVDTFRIAARIARKAVTR